MSNIDFICLVHQIALNDEFEAFIGYFKLSLDLTKLNKYFYHCFDGQRFLGINNDCFHTGIYQLWSKFTPLSL